MKFIETDIPARLDSLPWTRKHTMFLLTLGITWILDAFEVVIVGNVLKSMSLTLNLSGIESSLMVSGFLLGAIIGSFFFGYLADRYGRKKVFIATLLLYSGGTFLTGMAVDFYTAFTMRIVAGMGIGGEFAAIHSAVDEFIPSRHRGKVDGFIVASWNIGSILASLTAIGLIKNLPEELAWRVAFLIGGILAILIAFIRRYVPESPRWLLSQGQLEEAERIVSEIEKTAGIKGTVERKKIRIFKGNAMESIALIFKNYRWRFIFSTSMSLTILTTYYGIITLIPVSLAPNFNLSSEDISHIFLAGSIGGLIGGVVVAIMADALGRKATGISIALLSTISTINLLNPNDFKTAYYLYSLFAFSFASVAYVSAMEIFPTHVRSTAIGLISILGRIGGTIAPPLLVSLSAYGYSHGIFGLLAFWILGLSAFILWGIFGIEAGKRSLEDIT